jgi:hypothetical protein
VVIILRLESGDRTSEPRPHSVEVRNPVFPYILCSVSSVRVILFVKNFQSLQLDIVGIVAVLGKLADTDTLRSPIHISQETDLSREMLKPLLCPGTIWFPDYFLRFRLS